MTGSKDEMESGTMDRGVQKALEEDWLLLIKSLPNSNELTGYTDEKDGGIKFLLNKYVILSVTPLEQIAGYKIVEFDAENDTEKVSHSMHPDIAGTVKHILEQFLINDLKSFLIKSI